MEETNNLFLLFASINPRISIPKTKKISMGILEEDITCAILSFKISDPY